MHWLFYAIPASLATLVSALLVVFPWLRYDMKMLWILIKAKRLADKWSDNAYLMPDLFQDQANKYPSKKFLLYQNEKYTYSEANEKATQFANMAQQTFSLTKTDSAVLLAYNTPNFVWTYLGFLKLGIQIAFLNFHLRHKSLLHCIAVSEAKVLIVGEDDDLHEAVQEIQSELNDLGVRIFSYSDVPREGFTPLNPLLAATQIVTIPRSERSHLHFHSTCSLIYTSGTTGLPKAARVGHHKALLGALLAVIYGMTEKDTVYTALPLYHTAANVLGLGAVVLAGGTLALAKKFSASRYWDDCDKFGATFTQYIGEMARYLLAQPKKDSDNKHVVRVAYGNGLRADIWKEFKERFNIEVIGEFYGATEGNFALFNVFNKTGCIGRASPLMDKLLPVFRLKFDVENNDVCRDNNGCCIKAGIGEPGLLVGEINEDLCFDGYTGSKEMSQKKILKNVFKKGDTFFNTGDLVTADSEYFIYFSDRTGDTFRWKGENVSTTEVANVLTDLAFVLDANVYGVEVPGHEGRCGMAAITLQNLNMLNKEQLSMLAKQNVEYLPTYARMFFLRVVEDQDITGTFKQRKMTLLREGFRPSEVNGSLYFFNKDHYIELTQEVYHDILAGEYRF